MTFTEAAILVLRLAGKPLHFKEITDVAIERSLLSHVGKNPEVTMGARLSAQVKKNEKDNPLTRVKPGVFALAHWDERTVSRGLADRRPALDLVSEEGLRQAIAAEPLMFGSESSEVTSPDAELDEEPVSAPAESIAPPPDDEEIHRAELSAAATELFEPEDDDDQPIFGEAPEEEAEEEDGEPKEGRRRRRRRRGKRRDNEVEEGEDDLPAYTVSDAPSDEVLAEVLEEAAPPPLGLGSAPLRLANQLAQTLGKYDANRGPVAVQNVADALKKVGALDGAAGPAAVIAAAISDNYLREKQGEAPLFRVTGGKVGLVAWSLDRRGADRLSALGRASQEIRSLTVKGLSEQLAKLPQRALGDLVLVLLERMGVQRMTLIKRPGTHGAELHLAARAAQPIHGYWPGQEARGGVPVAICIRRDAKDVGRERVTELRGALHHYEGASQGWLITAGQVLSGAREEAASSGASPMVLIGRTELAELCVTYGVGVKVHRVEVPVVDADLFDSLSSR